MADFTQTATVKTEIREPLLLGETILQSRHVFGMPVTHKFSAG